MTAVQTPIRQNAPIGLSASRIGAIVLRHYYLLKGSWARFVDLAYWPTMQMIIWGFTTKFFIEHSSWVAQATGVLLSAVLLWDIVFRSQIGLTVSFLEEQWSRNLANLFVTPLKPSEFALALMTMSVIRTLLGVGPAVLLAIPLYHFSLFDLGLPLIPFFACLMMMGWGIGLAVCGLLLRFGNGAEGLAWATVFGFAPISGIYYPIETLPAWLQPVAWATPAAYVFEGMRAVMYQGVFRWDLLVGALVIDAIYIGLGVALFLMAFRWARREGKLLQQGE
jgi:ABC-2 type transport system permease protein